MYFWSIVLVVIVVTFPLGLYAEFKGHRRR